MTPRRLCAALRVATGASANAIVTSAPAQLMMMPSHCPISESIRPSGTTTVEGPCRLSPRGPWGRYNAFTVSAVSLATNLRCSSSPTSARHSPNVSCPSFARWRAARARTNLFFGTVYVLYLFYCEQNGTARHYVVSCGIILKHAPMVNRGLINLLRMWELG